MPTRPVGVKLPRHSANLQVLQVIVGLGLGLGKLVDGPVGIGDAALLTGFVGAILLHEARHSSGPALVGHVEDGINAAVATVGARLTTDDYPVNAWRFAPLNAGVSA